MTSLRKHIRTFVVLAIIAALIAIVYFVPGPWLMIGICSIVIYWAVYSLVNS